MEKQTLMPDDQLRACVGECQAKYRPEFRCWILVLFEILSKKAAMIPARLGFVLQPWQNSVIPKANYVISWSFRFLKTKFLKFWAKYRPKKLLGHLFALNYLKSGNHQKQTRGQIFREEQYIMDIIMNEIRLTTLIDLSNLVPVN